MNGELVAIGIVRKNAVEGRRQVQLPLLSQKHHRCGCEGLRNGGDLQDRGGAVRNTLLDGGLAIPFVEEDIVPFGDEHHTRKIIGPQEGGQIAVHRSFKLGRCSRGHGTGSQEHAQQDE
jgi:hypothetical protein